VVSLFGHVIMLPVGAQCSCTLLDTRANKTVLLDCNWETTLKILVGNFGGLVHRRRSKQHDQQGAHNSSHNVLGCR
jgi:hypothetical protein